MAARNLAREARRLGIMLGGRTQRQLNEFALELDAFVLILEATDSEAPGELPDALA
jgi:hypothetical protein